MTIHLYEELKINTGIRRRTEVFNFKEQTDLRFQGSVRGWKCFLTSSALPIIAASLLLVNAPKSSLGIFFFLNRDSPVVKGNALLALSSLAVVVSKHEASLCSDSDGVLEVS